jgi:hypothetical protein
MDFTSALWDLILGDGRLSTEFKGSAVLVFGVGSALFGLAAVLLDFIFFSVRKRSIFDLSYGENYRNVLRLVCLWGLGAGVGGFLGAAAGILQLTRAACIGVGVGWPLILPRLIDSFTRRQQEEEQTSEEEHE